MEQQNFKAGETVLTETYDMTTKGNIQNCTGSRFVTGTIISITGDVVKLDTGDGVITTLTNQIEKT